MDKKKNYVVLHHAPKLKIHDNSLVVPATLLPEPPVAVEQEGENRRHHQHGDRPAVVLLTVRDNNRPPHLPQHLPSCAPSQMLNFRIIKHKTRNYSELDLGVRFKITQIEVEFALYPSKMTNHLGRVHLIHLLNLMDIPRVPQVH